VAERLNRKLYDVVHGELALYAKNNLLKMVTDMIDGTEGTSAGLDSGEKKQTQKATGPCAFVDASQPIVPVELRESFRGERWIAGKPCVVQEGVFSTALLVDVSFSPLLCNFIAQYHYENVEEALLAMRDWDGRRDPPGRWMKEVVTGRMGPGVFDDRCS